MSLRLRFAQTIALLLVVPLAGCTDSGTSHPGGSATTSTPATSLAGPYVWREIYNKTLLFPTKNGEPNINESFQFPVAKEVYINATYEKRIVAVESSSPRVLWVNDTRQYFLELAPQQEICQNPVPPYKGNKTLKTYPVAGLGTIQSVGYCNFQVTIVISALVALNDRRQLHDD